MSLITQSSSTQPRAHGLSDFLRCVKGAHDPQMVNILILQTRETQFLHVLVRTSNGLPAIPVVTCG